MASGRSVGAGRSSYNGYTSSRTTVMGIGKVLFQATGVMAAPLKHVLHDGADAEDPGMWLLLSLAAILVLLGGAFAGLTIALMGQDGIYLQVIATSGEGKEQRHAQKVFNLLQKGKHWVLVALLLSNVIVNETLPIVLDRCLGGGWAAVLGSTALIVLFGEIIPQSICVRYGLPIGAFMAPFVLGLMWVLAPLAWPTAKLLDYLLGEDHGTTYKKSGLKTLVTLHKTLGPSPHDRLNQDEVTIISAVLDLKDKAVGDIMTPMEDVFIMSADTILDEKTMDIILSAGYSRIPIHTPGKEGDFIGMLLVKILITYDPEDCRRVDEFALATLPETRPETSCLDIVNFFQEGKSHMVLVSDFPGENYGAIGVVTLEDVIEELIGEEIIDESDVYIDVHKAIRRLAPAPKARVAKGQFITNPEDTIEDENLIALDDNEDEPQRNASHKRYGSIGERTTNSAVLGSSPNPKTTFLMRRSSSAADGSPNKPIQIRGNAVDMREHLKHLGPSNHASNPKLTRWQNVKIKPGHPASPMLLSRQLTAPTSYRDLPPPAPQGGEGMGLLRSAGREASDGVQALQQGYGSFDRSNSPKITDENHKAIQVDNSTITFGDAPIKPSTSQESATDSNSDTIGSLPSSRGSNAPRKRVPARSGSITETVITAGDVRKMVLETNSSGDDREGDSKPSPLSAGSRASHSTPSLGNTLSREESIEHHGDGEMVKKKPKRRRKRKGGNKSDLEAESNAGGPVL